MSVIGTPSGVRIRTVRDLLTKAFKFVHILGANEPMDDDEANDSLDVLNDIIEQANIDKMLAYQKSEIVFSFQSGKSVYTVGPATYSPDVIAPRPVEILSAFSRRYSVDLPMFVGDKEDYDRIQLKTVAISGWEQMVYYEPAWPKGTLTFYMVPLDTFTEAHLTVMAEIPPFINLDQTVTLPPGYAFWLQCKVGERISPEYGMPFTPKMQDILTEAEASVKRNNMKPMPVAGTGLTGLTIGPGGKYNVYSDTTRR